MKTAVSIPDEIFKQIEGLAKRTGMSRSRLFSEALREYVARHASDQVTDAMDRVCAELGEATRRVHDKSCTPNPAFSLTDVSGGGIYQSTNR